MTGDRIELATKLLKQAVAEAGGGGKALVARRLGYSRPMIARVLSPNDSWQMSLAMADRIIDRLNAISNCPGTGRVQARAECLRFAAMPAAPTHNPAAIRIWRACQSCLHKPQGGQDVS
ncbi:MAG: LacI family transcriptional regulator [Candidatus Pacebacteria bacterium]|nr:LacI family transcriptional regulator [Candidatus Paceibacterota bacterium]